MNHPIIISVIFVVYCLGLSDKISAKPTADSFTEHLMTSSSNPVTRRSDADTVHGDEFESYDYTEHDDDDEFYVHNYDNDNNDNNVTLNRRNSTEDINMEVNHGQLSNNTNKLSSDNSFNVTGHVSRFNDQSEPEFDQTLAVAKRNSGTGVPNVIPGIIENSVNSGGTNAQPVQETNADTTLSRDIGVNSGGGPIGPVDGGLVGPVDGGPLGPVDGGPVYGQAVQQQTRHTVSESPNCQTVPENNSLVGSDRSPGSEHIQNNQQTPVGNQLPPCETTSRSGQPVPSISSSGNTGPISNVVEAGVAPQNAPRTVDERSGLGRPVVVDTSDVVDLEHAGVGILTNNTNGSSGNPASIPGSSHLSSNDNNNGGNAESSGPNIVISESSSNSSRNTGQNVHLEISEHDQRHGIFPETNSENENVQEMPNTNEQHNNNQDVINRETDKLNNNNNTFQVLHTVLNPTPSYLNVVSTTQHSTISSSVPGFQLPLSDMSLDSVRFTESELRPSSSIIVLPTEHSRIIHTNGADLNVQALQTSYTDFPETVVSEMFSSHLSNTEVKINNIEVTTSTIQQLSVSWFTTNIQEISTPSSTTPLYETTPATSTQEHTQTPATSTQENTQTPATSTQENTHITTRKRTDIDNNNAAKADMELNNFGSTLNPSIVTDSTTDNHRTVVDVRDKMIIYTTSRLASLDFLSSSLSLTSQTWTTSNDLTGISETNSRSHLPLSGDSFNTISLSSTIEYTTDAISSAPHFLSPHVTYTTTTESEYIIDSNPNMSENETDTTFTNSPQSVTSNDLINVAHSEHDDVVSPSQEGNRNWIEREVVTDVTTKPETLTTANMTSSITEETESPSIFMELKFGMSWPNFCQNQDLIRSELVEIVHERDRRVEININQIQVMSRERAVCYTAQLSETDEISVRMYLLNKSHHFDRVLTRTCGNLLVSGLTVGYSSVLRIKLLAVRIHDEDNREPTTGASVNVSQQDDDTYNPLSDPGVAIAIALSTLGGCYCLGLIILQIILRHRNKLTFMSGLNRSLSATSSDSIQLSSVNKSRPNSGLFNPGLDITDCMEPSNPLNFIQLSKFTMEEKNIYQEYQRIPHRLPRLSVVPVGDEDKNRYANVLPLAHTRVRLLPDEPGSRSSYINANFVTGPNNKSQYYIATQAPTDKTASDFWNMVWQQRCQTIVMLTQLEEEGQVKSANYWPELVGKSAAQRHGHLLIELKQKDVHQEYIVSKMEINNLREIESRQVEHFWYTCWPSVGAPEPISLVKLVLDTRPRYETSNCPLVVHCSPGTGRTCTFIALDMCMRQFDETRTVDVVRTVYLIRQERAGAIQNKEQYTLLYNSLSEYATVVMSPVVSAASSATTLHALLQS